jgi:lipopolysaccharide export system permease protein
LSLARISLPYLVVGLFLSFALFVLNEKFVPDVSGKVQEIMKSGGQDATGSNPWRYVVNFRNARENRIWNIAALNTTTFELRQPHVEWRLPDGSRKQLIAKAGARTNDQWVFYDVELFTYEAEINFETSQRPLSTNEMILPELNDTPEEILLQIKFQQMNAREASKRTQLSLGEIDYLSKHLELNARDRALLQTQFHARLAQPWTCLVVALVALPFGAGTNSRRNVFVGVAASIFICFTYFILLRVGLALGTGSFVPPWVAAWFPNLFFATLGLFLVWRIK